MLTISIGVSFSTVASFVQTDVNKKEMQQVASQVSLNLIEIATLTNSSGYAPMTLVKTMALPSEVSGRAYFVELVNETSQGKGYAVKVSLVSQPSVNVESPLPFNSTSGQTIVVTSPQNWAGTSCSLQQDIVPCSKPSVTYINEINGNRESIVYGGSNSTVWAYQEPGVLYMGIGYLKK